WDLLSRLAADTLLKRKIRDGLRAVGRRHSRDTVLLRAAWSRPARMFRALVAAASRDREPMVNVHEPETRLRAEGVQSYPWLARLEGCQRTRVEKERARPMHAELTD